jgi:hypothetical protein
MPPGYAAGWRVFGVLVDHLAESFAVAAFFLTQADGSISIGVRPRQQRMRTCVT